MTTWDVVRSEQRAMTRSQKPESWNSFAIQTGVILVEVGVLQVLLTVFGRALSWGSLAVFLATCIGVWAFDTSWRVRQWRGHGGPRTVSSGR